MNYRTLGRTGVRVSPLCLGAMMFGALGNPDHDDSIRIIHRALDAGINFVDTADVYSAGESEEIVGKALKGRRDDVVLATKVHGPMGDDPNQQGNSRRWIIRECENSLRRLRHRLDRPLPDPPARDPTRDIDETLGRADRPVRAGQGPLHRQLDVPGLGDRRGAVDGRAPRPRTVRHASSRRTRCSCEASRPTCCPVCQRYGMGVIPWSPLAGGWLSGRYRKGQDIRPAAGRSGCRPATTCRCPANQRKLDAADALGRAGREGRDQPRRTWPWPSCSGTRPSPRPSSGLAPWSSSSASSARSTSTLADDVLDAIDEIVPPGTTLNNSADAGWTPPALTDPSLRRR